MPRFCANLTYLFTDLDLPERVGAARRTGFEAVEILFPYDGDAAALRGALLAHDMPLALINCPPPNYIDPDGPRGFAAVEAEAGRFRSAFRRALRYARTLKAERIHVMAGAAEGPGARAVFVDNLRWAVDEADGLPLTIEPINRHDMPGYFLHDFDTAIEVLGAVGAAPDRLGLQFDVYHAARITGDAVATWDRVNAAVTHVQFADTPGRGAPGSGALDFPAMFDRIDRAGYDGWVSAEYRPDGPTEDGLSWLSRG